MALAARHPDVTLRPARAEDLPRFGRDLRDAFLLAIRQQPWAEGAAVPDEADIEESAGATGAAVWRVMADGVWAGGAIVQIDPQTHRNQLDLFYVAAGMQGRGIGQTAWLAIERQYPQTRLWETHTPWFDRRNIHFYVNKCGFRIVEYFNRLHQLPDGPDLAALGHDGGMFRLEKAPPPLPLELLAGWRPVPQTRMRHMRNRPCPVTSRIRPLSSIHARLR